MLHLPTTTTRKSNKDHVCCVDVVYNTGNFVELATRMTLKHPCGQKPNTFHCFRFEECFFSFTRALSDIEKQSRNKCSHMMYIYNRRKLHQSYEKISFIHELPTRTLHEYHVQLLLLKICKQQLLRQHDYPHYSVDVKLTWPGKASCWSIFIARSDSSRPPKEIRNLLASFELISSHEGETRNIRCETKNTTIVL